MKNQNRRPAWYQPYKAFRPTIIGAIATIIVFSLFLLVLAPVSAIGIVSLPEDVKPVAVNFGSLTPEVTIPSPTPTLAPAPTLTPTLAPPTPTAAASLAPTPVSTPTPTPEPTIVPTPTPLPPLPGIMPRRFRIPSLGINAYVEHVGLDSENRMDVPRNIWNVAWYKLGAKPGERGNSVIDGHVDGPNTPAVFWTLKNVQLGSKIYVQDDKGEEKVFEVFDTGIYPYDQAPLDRIFGGSTDAQLNIITCTGVFDQSSHNYDRRFVAYARLVDKG